MVGHTLVISFEKYKQKISMVDWLLPYVCDEFENESDFTSEKKAEK